ncbi:MAG: biotin-dependent carboxyltransferase family protein [Paracoccaceae bacterium]
MIEVRSLPPLATVQDLGRDGYWAQGLGRAGAMDPVSHRLANLLLGNDVTAATLEIPMTPGQLRFGARMAFALTGAACGAMLDSRPLPRIFAGIAEAGQTLALGPMQSGARVYLALTGGIDVPMVLGSRSTQLREGFGGFAGRVLRPGDTLQPASDRLPCLPANGLSLTSPTFPLPAGTIKLRALRAAEYDEFTPAAQAAFWSGAYQITPQSNRQGYRLEGADLSRTSSQELRSHGIVPGIVQVPNGGQPIIQLADSATMGGYPKIAAVIEADLWRLGQARPGDRLHFVETDARGAADAERELSETMATVEKQLADVTAQHLAWS